jgi:hypothetical protein
VSDEETGEDEKSDDNDDEEEGDDEKKSDVSDTEGGDTHSLHPPASSDLHEHDSKLNAILSKESEFFHHNN